VEKAHRVLLVNEDRDLVDLLEFVLKRSGFDVLPTPSSAMEQVAELLGQSPTLAIVSLGDGSRDGIDLLGFLRARSTMPILVLTDQSSTDEAIHALEIGADDCIARPFSYRELVARIQAKLRRYAWQLESNRAAIPIEVGSITLDPTTHLATVGGQMIDLTATEFSLLYHLLLNNGAVVPSRVIFHQIWGFDDSSPVDVVGGAINRLRRKLSDIRGHRVQIRTVPGVGFRLDAD